MTKNQTIDRLFETIGVKGIEALVREGIRRRMSVREIAKHLNIPLDNAGFFAIGHENEFPLEPGERVCPLPGSRVWCGHGTVIEQCGESVKLRKDGTAKNGDSGIITVMRAEVVLSDMPELLPEGATFNDVGYLVVPCKPTPDGMNLHFHCPHCKKWHLHGIGNGGYRVPHCQKQDSPLLARGSIYLVAPTLQ
jgi:hypothetical protein